MRWIAFISLFFVYSSNVSAHSYDVLSARKALDKALIEKDTVTLNELLHEDVVYGHSNGWIETKRDVIEDLYNGKLEYKKIEDVGYYCSCPEVPKQEGFLTIVCSIPICTHKLGEGPLKKGRFYMSSYGKKETAITSIYDVDVVVEGKQIQLRLSVMQVWQKKGKHWRLIARQSVKVS